ncbi:MAG: sugar phosphate isomerase/epimerase [Phycisphaerales bacterium]|nr:sugar phosphate isomerase/epimerase [Phycisphaerales bacterium]
MTGSDPSVPVAPTTAAGSAADSASCTRRSFVGAVAAAAAFGATIPRLHAEARPVTRSIRKALKYGMVRVEGTVEEKFALLKAIGYDGVELDSPSNLDRDEVLRARDKTGLVIPGVVDSVHWSKTLGDPDPNVRAEGRRGLETAMRDCHAYGGTSVLLVPAVVNKSIGYAEAYERSQAEIRQVLPMCEELKVAIAFENVWNHFLLSPLEAARYVDEFESPWIGWHFDVGNIVNYGWPEQWIRTLGPRILKLDIKEFSRKRRDDEGLWKGFGVEIGEGDCDWPAVMAALDEIGYNGWAAAEVGGGDRARLEDIARRMDAVFAA